MLRSRFAAGKGMEKENGEKQRERRKREERDLLSEKE